MRRLLLPLTAATILVACQAPSKSLPQSTWIAIGDAHFDFAEDDVIHGSGRDLPRNSFLVNSWEYADFELTVEVRIEGGNSGIQVRSHMDGFGVTGYQIEIDPSERAWSGGLYDEGRRGWLDSNEGKEEARAAFDPDGWNHYRIVCRGDHIQTWVNGVPCADYHDDADASGLIALQVHGGARTDVWWRRLRIREL